MYLSSASTHAHDRLTDCRVCIQEEDEKKKQEEILAKCVFCVLEMFSCTELTDSSPHRKREFDNRFVSSLHGYR